MKKTLYLSLLTILAITSCKKQDSNDVVAEADSKLHANTKGVMTLPGLYNVEQYLEILPDGTYAAGWEGGSLRFSAIVYATGNFYDGDPVESIELASTNPVEGSYWTSGPFCYRTMANFNAPVNFIAGLHEFFTSYDNFVSGEVNPNTGQPLQSYWPLLSDYVSPNSSMNGPTIFTGQIVRSHSSPSTFSVVPMSFIPAPHPID